MAEDRLIRRGASSAVYETMWNGERVARKDYGGVSREGFEREASALAGLPPHENLVRTVGWEGCSLFVEYVEDDLSGLLALPLDLPEVLGIMLQIARGVECLHSNGMAHGDMEPKNIRVTRNSKVVKVSNYGLVRIKPHVDDKLDIVRWKAPEHFTVLFEDGGAELPLTADVYSFAVTCAYILTGEDPYPANLDWTILASRILFERTRPSLPDDVHPQLRELLVSCWSVPACRPTFSEVCVRLEELQASLIQELVPEEPPGPDLTPEPSIATTNVTFSLGESSSPEGEDVPSSSVELAFIVYGKPPEEAAQIGAEYLVSLLQTDVYTGFRILLHCALKMPDGRRAVYTATCGASREKAIATAIANLARNQRDHYYRNYLMKLMVALTSEGGAGPDRDMINMEVAKGLDLFISIMKEEVAPKTRLLAAEAIANILVYTEVRQAVRSQSGVVAAFVSISKGSRKHIKQDFKRRAHAVCLKGLQRLARRPEEAGYNESSQETGDPLVAALLQLVQTGLGSEPKLTSLVEDSLVALKDQLWEMDKEGTREMIFKDMSTLMVEESFEDHTSVAGRMAIISIMSKLCGNRKDVVSAALEKFIMRFEKEGGIDALLALLRDSDSKYQREFALIALRDLDVQRPHVSQLPFETFLSILTEKDWAVEAKEAAAGLLDLNCADKFMENESTLETTLRLLEDNPDGPGGERIASLLLGIASQKASLKFDDRGLTTLVRYVSNYVKDSRRTEFEELLTATLVRFCKSGHACQEAVIQANGHVFLLSLLQDKEKEQVLKENGAQANGHAFPVTSRQEKEKRQNLKGKAAQGLLELLTDTETRGKVLEAGFVTIAMESIDTKFACPKIAIALASISSDPEGKEQIYNETRSDSALLKLLEDCPDPKGKDAAASVLADLYFYLDRPQDAMRREQIAAKFDLFYYYLEGLFRNLEDSEVRYITKFLAALATMAAESHRRSNLHECRINGLLADNLLTTQPDIQGHILKILVELTVVCESEPGPGPEHALEKKIRDGLIDRHMIADKLSALLKPEELSGRVENLKCALRLIRNLSFGIVSELKLGEKGSISVLLEVIRRHQTPVSEVTGLAIKALEKFLYDPRAKEVTRYYFFRRRREVTLTGMQVFLEEEGVETLSDILKLAVHGKHKSSEAVIYSIIILLAVARDAVTRIVACKAIFNCEILSALKEVMASSIFKGKVKYNAAVLLETLAMNSPTAEFFRAMRDKGCLKALITLSTVQHCEEVANHVLEYLSTVSPVCKSSIKKLRSE